MKKLFSVLLVLALVFSLAACGGDDVGKGEDGDGAVTPALKVGFIYIGVINDGGYTQAHNDAVEKMKEHFGGLVETTYVESISDTDKAASLDAATNLIDQGCNVVVGCSFGFMDSLEELANSGDYDDVTFLHFSGYKANDSNFSNFFGSIEEARYLTGMIAGSMTETNKLGYVGAHPYTEVQVGINAFTLGAQSVNPDAEVQVVYINSWYDPEKERAAADELVAAGCDVLAQHCDTTGPQVAASEGGAYSIGYNYPNKVAENAYLTAAIWHHEVYLIDTIQSIIDGNFDTTPYYGTMADGYVDIGEMTDLVPADVQELVNAKKQEMIDGTFSPFTGEILFNDGSVWVPAGETLKFSSVADWPSELKLVKGAAGAN